MKSLVFSVFLLSSCLLYSQDRREYIERYSGIAVQEMHRTGIPASIKLAQAILESGAGTSDLARKGNNHFGIKCGNEWRGKKYMQKDDDRNKSGRLVKSCFREFSHAEESFIAHSDFLSDPAKSHRYGFLFDYDPTDYKAWAHGLKKAGYATNPKYPDLLIKIIKDYELYAFDSEGREEGRLARNTKKTKENEEDWMIDSDGYAHEASKEASRPERYNNDVRFVFAQEGDRAFDIAQYTETAVWRIIQYNEGIDNETQELEKGERVYLQKKRRNFRGRQKFHLVREGEEMEDLAQKYAVRLDALCKRNQMSETAEPAAGQKILLRGRRKEAPRLRESGYAEERKRQGVKDTLEMQAPPESDPMEEVMPETKPIAGANTTEDLIRPEYLVQKGDTLYGIARIHGLSLDDLKKMNNLDGDTIHPGQKIRLAQ